MARLSRAAEGAGRATLVISEEELTALLRQALADGPARDLTLHVTDEALYLHATLGQRGIPICAVLALSADQGRLAVHVSCLTVNNRAWPRAASAAAECVLSALAADAAWSPPITGVALANGTLTLDVELDPAPGA